MTPVNNFPYFAKYSTPRAFVDILFPDPVELNDMYGNIIQTKSLPYSERINKVYFRENFTSFRAVGKDLLSSVRVQVHLLSDQYPHLFDIGLVGASSNKIEQWNGFEDLMHSLNLTPCATNSCAEANQFKFQLDLDGRMGSGRTVWILKYGSVMLKVMSPFQQYADPFLVPFKHYIPVDQHMHYLKPITEWCLNNPELMETIAANTVDLLPNIIPFKGNLFIGRFCWKNTPY